MKILIVVKIYAKRARFLCVMMTMKQKELLHQLREQTSSIVEIVETEIIHLPYERLNWKSSMDQWSVFQCFEHLNLYNRYYLNALSRAIEALRSSDLAEKFEYTWIGRKSVDMMRPSNAKKQKTFKRMVPSASTLNIDVIKKFLDDQKVLLVLIDQSEKIDINDKLVPVEFFKLLKMNIGETIEFVVVHEQRHLQQAKNALANFASKKTPVLAL